MTDIEGTLQAAVGLAIQKLFNIDDIPPIGTQRTRKDFEGDFTVVVFPYTKFSKKSPEETAELIGEELKSSSVIAEYNVVKGFLNLSLPEEQWNEFFNEAYGNDKYGLASSPSGKKRMVEYSSPNTNKPLHLGHLRNNFLGYSMSRILAANGHEVIKTQIINDRGVHICKSMLAWKKWGNGETPESSGMKADHLVGKYYVIFDQYYQAEINELVKDGMSRDEAKQQAPLMIEVRKMLQAWEEKDEATVSLWKSMNNWVYEGWEETYRKMGVDFDQLYYESETYLYGKELVDEGLQKGIFFEKQDGSIWVDLTDRGLDEKILRRSDGTSVYMTQDIGTAIQRFEDNKGLAGLTYVVGNEQDYHFKALFIILEKLGYSWAAGLHHLSYGMVDLPEGRMKTREGTVVDADDLMDEMVSTAKQTALELGKLDDFTEEEKDSLYEQVGLGALKYFMLKVDAKKRMLFDPAESIDFTGNTGPFIQYTYARIQSILRKSETMEIPALPEQFELTDLERTILHSLYEFPGVIENAGITYNPALIANYIYDLVKEYNQYYQSTPILKAEHPDVLAFRLACSEMVGKVIRRGLYLLGIEVPSRM